MFRAYALDNVFFSKSYQEIFLAREFTHNVSECDIVSELNLTQCQDTEVFDW